MVRPLPSGSLNLSYAYSDNRIAGHSYDADGRDTTNGGYDAAGKFTGTNDGNFTITPSYSGDGREEKRRTQGTLNLCPLPPYQLDMSTYYIRSTVLGGEVVSEAATNGAKFRSYVHAAGTVVAWSTSSGGTYQHTDASGMSRRSTDNNGSVVANSFSAFADNGSPVESDPFGGNAGVSAYTPGQPGGGGCPGGGLLGIFPGGNTFQINNGEPTINVDGFAMPYWTAVGLARAGGLAVNAVGPHGQTVTNSHGQPLQYAVDYNLGRMFVPRTVVRGVVEGREIRTDWVMVDFSWNPIQQNQRGPNFNPDGESTLQEYCPPVPLYPSSADLDANIEWPRRKVSPASGILQNRFMM